MGNSWLDNRRNKLLLTPFVWVVCGFLMYVFWRLLLPDKWEILQDRYTAGSDITPFYDVLALWLLFGLLVAGATKLFGKIFLLPLSLLYPIFYSIQGSAAELKLSSTDLERLSPEAAQQRLASPENDFTNWSIGAAIFIIFPLCLITIILIQKFILDTDNREKNVLLLKYLSLFFGTMGLVTLLGIADGLSGEVVGGGFEVDTGGGSPTASNQTLSFHGPALFIFCMVKLKKHSITRIWPFVGFLIYGYWEETVSPADPDAGVLGVSNLELYAGDVIFLTTQIVCVYIAIYLVARICMRRFRRFLQSEKR